MSGVGEVICTHVYTNVSNLELFPKDCPSYANASMQIIAIGVQRVLRALRDGFRLSIHVNVFC